MDKQAIINDYSKSEDKLLISKLLDKMNLCKTKNRIEYLDFLDIYQQTLLQKIIRQEKITNVIFTGGIEEAERKLVVFYPEKLSYLIETNMDKVIPIKCIRIQLPKEMEGQYTHRQYLGGLMKLGIKRETIGDILVFKDGADILILEDIEKFLLANLASLTRFSKARIEVIPLKEVRKKEINTKKINIIVPSLRLDAVTAEILRTSRGKAEDLLKEGRIFINYECIQKGTKQVKENDIITVRGKGKFKLGKQEGITKNGRVKLVIYQYI